MGKAINALVNKQEDTDQKNVIKLHVLDRNHKHGGYEKLIVKEKHRNPMINIVSAIREVKYLYDKDIVTHGWEIVREFQVPIDEYHADKLPVPVVVESVTRDNRDPNYVPERKEYQRSED